MATSLLDWIMHLLQNPEAREQFQANPQAAMSSAGLGSICGQDVRDARAFLLDNPNVHQVRQGQETHSDSGHDHINYLLNNYSYEPKQHAAQESRPEHFGRVDHVRADGNGSNHHSPRVDHNHHVSHYDRVHDDSHDRHLLHDDSHNRWAHVDDSHDRHNHSWHEFGVGPTTEGGTGGDQHDSRVGHNQLEMGGRGNLLGDGNDFSDRGQRTQTQTRTDNRATTTSSSSDSHRHDQTVRGNGSAGHDITANHTNTVDHTDTTVNGNGASGHDLHADHTNVSGNGSAGRDVHVDKNGPVMGQGMANGDIDHTGSLAGLDHTVSVGDVNLLSGLVSTGDVLNGSLDHSLNHVVDHSPILSPLSDDPVLSNDPILSGDLDRSPVLSGNLNNTLNHVLNGNLNHDLDGDLNHSLNGVLDDLLHNIDVHNIHSIVDGIGVLGTGTGA